MAALGSWCPAARDFLGFIELINSIWVSDFSLIIYVTVSATCYKLQITSILAVEWPIFKIFDQLSE